MSRAIACAFAAVIVGIGQRPGTANPPTVQETGRPEDAILRRANMNIKNIEPAWHFIGANCKNCPRLMAEQLGVAAGLWEQPGHDNGIAVRVHGIASAEAASQFLIHATQEVRLPPGWSIADYELADGAYIAIYEDGMRYEVSFQKGRFLVFVSGEARADVERFARYLLSAISETE